MDKSQEKSLLLWLKSHKKACGHYLSLSVLLGMLTGGALVVQAWLLATSLHGLIILHLPRSAFTAEFIALIGIIMFRALLAYGRERISFMAGQRLREQIREAVLTKLGELGPAFIKGKPAGSWASIVLEQVEDLHDFYAKYLPQMMLAGFIPLIILVIVFPINWAAGLMLALTAPLIPMFMILVGMGAADANRKNFTALSRLSGHFMDRLKGLSTIKLFYRGAAEEKAIEKASNEFRERTMSVLKMAFLSSAVLEFFAAVSIAVLAVYFGFSYLGHLDFGSYGTPVTLFTGFFVLILAPEFFQPLRDLGTHYHAKAQAIGAAEALQELLSFEVESQSIKSLPEADIAPALVNSGCEKVSGPVGVKIKNLVVTSFEGHQLLGPLSFELNAGEHMAIVGPSGAGKTTLLNALLGFLPYTGEIWINDVLLSEMDVAHWRKQLTWLGQDPQLFHGTVRDNVAMANPNLTDEAIVRLLTQAKVMDFVEQLALGIDHPIGEQSSGVSVGQAQRIALARALAQQAHLYLLDEPTASLDSQSEQAVLLSLSAAMQDKTSIMITHRLDQLQHKDQILVLDKGKLVQQGLFDVIAAKEGLFSDMLNEVMQPFTLSSEQEGKV
ncbi:heme ABC transporter permease/ATP-binding protein CydD [Shewanella surugensis]|uniref:Cysteine/glutathione ABC transporter permease/ATP-binding protein CydD n=1 Tax=Shewanella surugensis TaxID=212020 RepID=A0ABT0LD36_9GAMM|nr:cysteine/glutathione ABC transporter permease/ATP-binding protein CydD [Shewanella surugensis]MCL1125621.1 cysteine/glutathione ABC transporter permease/ATP-binding protein CydD [Shewanella surugensis]